MRKRRSSNFLLIVFLFLTINLCVAGSVKFDLVIKNGRLVDGSGNPWFYADLGIIAGKIAKIGWIDTSEAAQWLDAQNLIVAPGFIDVHTHVEGGITRIPTADNFIRMGVTTIVTGAVGLSTGLIYVPGTFAKTDEIIALAKTAAQCKGVYASHIRNEGNEVVAAINEAIQFGERAGLPVEISHFKISSKKLWGQSQLTTSLIQQARERGLQVTVDQYAYPASSTGLETQLPDWVLDGGRDAAMARLREAKQRARARQIRAREKIAAPRRRHSQNDLAAGANFSLLGSRPDSRRLRRRSRYFRRRESD